MSGMTATGGVTAMGPRPSGPIGLAYDTKPPDTDMRKAAELANYMRSGLNGLRQLENQGYELSRKARALIINASTSEDSKFFPQLVSQWSAKNLLTKNDQTYMAALMPVLQAAGHSLAGARLTLGQVRQNFESLVPVDNKNQQSMAQINQNRQNYYQGLLGEAGNALRLPQYSAALNDFQKLGPVTKVIGGKTYYKIGGKVYAK